MDNKQLFWIVPLCYVIIFIVIGYLFGLYFNVPKTITVDYGENISENIKYFADKMDNFSINYSGCPDCNCEDGNATGVNDCKNDIILDRIDKNIMELQDKEADNSSNSIYVIDTYIENCSMERSIKKMEDAILRIETAIKNNLTMK